MVCYLLENKSRRVTVSSNDRRPLKSPPMIANIKLTRGLYREILTDLDRPHPVAYERIGFVMARLGKISPSETVIIFTEYLRVPDEDYINDPKVGAHVGSPVIRSVMQKILDDTTGAFHVHLHPFPGRPQLSRTDIAGILPLIPSFRAVGPELPHGILLLSPDDIMAQIWLPGNKNPITAEKVTVVGYPTKFYAE